MQLNIARFVSFLIRSKERNILHDVIMYWLLNACYFFSFPWRALKIENLNWSTKQSLYLHVCRNNFFSVHNHGTCIITWWKMRWFSWIIIPWEVVASLCVLFLINNTFFLFFLSLLMCLSQSVCLFNLFFGKQMALVLLRMPLL